MRALIAATVMLLASAGTAEAATYSVTPGGSGTACSAAFPCGSVQAAYNRAQPGDAIEVRAGNYGSQSVTGQGKGTPSVTVRAVGGVVNLGSGGLNLSADNIRVVGPFRTRSMNLGSAGSSDATSRRVAGPSASSTCRTGTSRSVVSMASRGITGTAGRRTRWTGCAAG